MLSLLEIIKRTTEFFEKKGVEDARLNAELIVAHTLGLNRMQLYLQFERPLVEKELEAIRPLVRRRGAREPLQYILGSVEFHGLDLRVDARALIPRPETEQLVERIQEMLPQPPARYLDLGTGTGAIALALARLYPDAQGWAVDASAEALALARENAERNKLADRIMFLVSNWFEALPVEESFDLIVSNPPYLTEEEWSSAASEVRDHEPRTALVAPEAGAADLMAILAGARGRLNSGGAVFLETGIGHHASLTARAKELGYAQVESLQDWSGRDRFIRATVGAS